MNWHEPPARPTGDELEQLAVFEKKVAPLVYR